VKLRERQYELNAFREHYLELHFFTYKAGSTSDFGFAAEDLKAD
jgi:hypothetical protein